MNGHHTQRPAPPRLAVFSRMSIHSLVVLMTQNICVMRKSRQCSHATSVLYDITPIPMNHVSAFFIDAHIIRAVCVNQERRVYVYPGTIVNICH